MEELKSNTKLIKTKKSVLSYIKLSAVAGYYNYNYTELIKKPQERIKVINSNCKLK